MNITNETEMKNWLKNNLVDKKQAVKITNQSDRAFMQSVNNKKIVPFFEVKSGNTSSYIRLYLKSELEEYAKNKRK